MRRFQITSELDYIDVVRYAEEFSDSHVYALKGDLGAGKTTLVKSWLQHLDSKDHISSPTYAIINEYDTPSTLVYHMDLYRLNAMEEALEIGIEEYLFSGNLCLIEWPELISEILPLPYIEIQIELCSDDSREVIVRRVS